MIWFIRAGGWGSGPISSLTKHGLVYWRLILDYLKTFEWLSTFMEFLSYDGYFLIWVLFDFTQFTWTERTITSTGHFQYFLRRYATINLKWLEFHNAFILCCLPCKQVVNVFSSTVINVFLDILHKYDWLRYKENTIEF